jgi:3-polyprenyl-4-hydroxybenzoate decarboxylase
VVDDDIDIFDEKEVWWAIATRTQWDKDIRIIPGMKGVALDPSSVDGISAKVVIDATKPAPPAVFAERLDIPEKALKKAEKILAKL